MSVSLHLILTITLEKGATISLDIVRRYTEETEAHKVENLPRIESSGAELRTPLHLPLERALITNFFNTAYQNSWRILNYKYLSTTPRSPG